MYTRNILLLLISLGIVVHVVANNSELNPAYSLELHMMKLESELQPDSAESTYVRVIVWNTMPTRKHLQSHFDKFDLLRLEEQRLASGKFDVIEKSDSTYERFLYAHYPEQQSTVTIFVKVNFKNQKHLFSPKYFIEKVNGTLKKYGFIDEDESVHDQINANSGSLVIGYTVVIIIIVSFFIWWNLIRARRKVKNFQNEQTKTVSLPCTSISTDQTDENNKNLQESHTNSNEIINNTIN